MPTIITRGAGSAQGLGYASSSAAVTYIEDVFSTYLYTGNNTTLPIVNGIDLSTKGGMVWTKSRTNVTNHALYDTTRGVNFVLRSNSTVASTNVTGDLLSFNTNGYTIGTPTATNDLNFNSSGTFASWTFREQPKFFDVVTYTGDGAGSQVINHNLGSVPGCIIVKSTQSGITNWQVYHRSVGNTGALQLNTTSATSTSSSWWNNTTPTATQFTVGSNNNSSDPLYGGTYVAYLFAHNAGGFGLTGTDNVISCGSFTSDIAGVDINLGYEPQWVMVKVTNGVGLGWYIWDSMRGFVASTSGGRTVEANSSAAETDTNWISPTATGFKLNAGQSGTGNPFIYIAIRRGPMKVPTSGTSVFAPIYSAAAANTVLTTSFPVDLQIPAYTGATIGRFVVDRLRGVVTTAVDAATSPWMKTNSTDAETTGFNITRAWDNTGYQIPQYLGGATTVYFNFRRAPGFFDEVCYTGSNGFQDLSHNLGVTPQMVIIKNRSGAQNWTVGLQGITGTGKYLVLNSTAAVVSDVNYFGSSWTSTNVLVDGNIAPINQSGSNYVMYLFATVAGVSKVGSYTGTGTTQTINCGFTSGARFVMIKRTDSTGDWYVWDSARGIVAGNDPYLLLNSTAAEVTGTDYVDTASSGFEISSTAPAAINANGGSFIFFAVS